MSVVEMFRRSLPAPTVPAPAPRLSCGRRDSLMGWVCTMPPHHTPIHRDQSDEAFEFTWSEK